MGQSESSGERRRAKGNEKGFQVSRGGEDAIICLSQVLKDLVARISLNFPDRSLCQTGHYAKNFFKAGTQG